MYENDFFQQKDCDIHIQRPFFIHKKKITKMLQIPLRLSFYPRVKQNEKRKLFLPPLLNKQ